MSAWLYILTAAAALGLALFAWLRLRGAKAGNRGSCGFLKKVLLFLARI